MDEHDATTLFDELSNLDARVRAGEQPVGEITSLAEGTLNKLGADLRRWHTGQLSNILSALQWRRDLCELNPNTTTGLRLALHAVGLLATPVNSVVEKERDKADPDRQAALAKALRDW